MSISALKHMQVIIFTQTYVQSFCGLYTKTVDINVKGQAYVRVFCLAKKDHINGSIKRMQGLIKKCGFKVLIVLDLSGEGIWSGAACSRGLVSIARYLPSVLMTVESERKFWYECNLVLVAQACRR